MADPITREQVERAIEAAKAEMPPARDTRGPHNVSQAVANVIGANWLDVAPGYVLAAHNDNTGNWWSTIAALTRWHAELVAAETPRKAPDDTAPERLRERREALGLSRRGMAVIVQRHETGDVHWEPEDIRICEIPANPPHRASGRATYAAALSAAEAARLARAAAREMCHAKRQALTEATAAASIIRDAQQGGAS